MIKIPPPPAINNDLVNTPIAIATVKHFIPIGKNKNIAVSIPAKISGSSVYKAVYEKTARSPALAPGTLN